MRKLFLLYIFFVFLSKFSGFAADEKFVVVIDAGHGGKDTGATRGEYKEKSINLGVALALGKLIESNMKDVKVVYTRKSDVFIDLYKRAEIANKAKANMFISIHTNSTASKTTTAEGADTYILGLARSEENLAVAKRENSVILLEDNYNKKYEGFDPNSPESYIIFEFMTDKYMDQSLQFASNVQKGFQTIAKRKDRGVKQAGFLVLRESAMPSVLIELGFINNPTEAKYLSSSIGQRGMASAIFGGIEKYIKDFEKKQGYTSTAPSTKNSNKQVAPLNEKIKEKQVIVAVAEPAKSKKTDPVFVSKNNEANKISTIQEKVESAKTIKDSTKENVLNQKAKTTPSAPINNAKTDSKSSNSTSPTYVQGTVEYRVQFLISEVKLSKNSPQFKGLSPVKEYKDGNSYKYTYGSTKSENEAIKLQNQVRSKFKDAFVVKFKDNIRIK